MERLMRLIVICADGVIPTLATLAVCDDDELALLAVCDVISKPLTLVYSCALPFVSACVSR
jgi:hypothetical protein